MARSVARFTVAEATPGTDAMAFSTRKTQDAQVMPSIPKSEVADVATGIPTSDTIFI